MLKTSRNHINERQGKAMTELSRWCNSKSDNSQLYFTFHIEHSVYVGVRGGNVIFKDRSRQLGKCFCNVALSCQGTSSGSDVSIHIFTVHLVH